MRAMQFWDYGGIGAVRLEEAPVPVPGADGVLIAVRAAGVNPFDWYAVEGLVRGFVAFALPAVVGRDVSGVVAAVGAGVRRFAVGDAVYGQADPLGDGTFAEFTCVAEERLALKPAGLSHVEAASLPNVTLAAWNGLFSRETGLDVQAGQRVLVHGGAGGIGSVAVQLARWRGARVVATASGANVAFVRGLGAAEVVDGRQAGWVERVGRLDGVLDTTDGGMLEALCGALGRGGCYVGLRGMPAPEVVARWASAGVRCRAASGPDSVAEFAAIAAAVAGGAVRAVVSEVYPLAEARQALERQRDGHVRGKIVLEVG